MKTFEISLKGFDGNTDETDHLVKWINATDIQEVESWLETYDLTQFVASGPFELEMPALSYADGVDVRVTEDGSNRERDEARKWVREVAVVLCEHIESGPDGWKWNCLKGKA